MTSMKPTVAQYAEALLRAFQEAGDHGVDQVINNLVTVLSADGTLELYPEVVAAFEQLVQAPERGGPHVQLGRSQHLTKSEADALNAVAARQQPVVEEVAEELVGGVVIRLDDTVVDGSVAGVLARMRRQLGED